MVSSGMLRRVALVLLQEPHGVTSQKTPFSVTFSPQANYTDLSTATCWRNLVSTFVDRGVSHGQRGGSSTVVNLSFLDRRMSCMIIKNRNCVQVSNSSLLVCFVTYFMKVNKEV
jgi:hypothetical protein